MTVLTGRWSVSLQINRRNSNSMNNIDYELPHTRNIWSGCHNSLHMPQSWVAVACANSQVYPRRQLRNCNASNFPSNLNHVWNVWWNLPYINIHWQLGLTTDCTIEFSIEMYLMWKYGRSGMNSWVWIFMFKCPLAVSIILSVMVSHNAGLLYTRWFARTVSMLGRHK